MLNPHFEYLDERQRALEAMFEELITTTSKKLIAEKLKNHRTKFDATKTQLDELSKARGAKIKAAWKTRNEVHKLYHYTWADEPPTRLTYDEAAAVAGYAASTLRVRVSQSQMKAIAYYKFGRWHVLAKEPSGLAVLDEIFRSTNNPDDFRILSPKPKALRA